MQRGGLVWGTGDDEGNMARRICGKGRVFGLSTWSASSGDGGRNRAADA